MKSNAMSHEKAMLCYYVPEDQFHSEVPKQMTAFRDPTVPTPRVPFAFCPSSHVHGTAIHVEAQTVSRTWIVNERSDGHRGTVARETKKRHLLDKET